MRKQKKKIGVIVFHKDIKKIYRPEWIQKCVGSIIGQTNQDFKVYEINYGGDDYSIIKEFSKGFRRHKFIAEEFSNHAEAMNRIIDEAFKDGCEYVFNTNVDDYYELERFDKQIEYLKMGYDVVSSDFSYISEIDGNDQFLVRKHIKQYGSVEDNLRVGHNVIAHPVVAFNKKFWSENRYDPSEIPNEDYLLWVRAINGGCKFYIHDDSLLNYRLHGNQITGDNRPKSQVIHSSNSNQQKPEGSSIKIDGNTPLRNIKFDF